MLDLQTQPHRRFNPLTREWVVVSPHRTARPWQGQMENVETSSAPEYDPDCYLCPGNARAGGARNPSYRSTFVFDNDFAALKPNGSDEVAASNRLLRAEGERGICRVVCFSPRHDLTLATMGVEQIRTVVDVWAEQFAELSATEWIQHVQIFENRGAMMGASNPHPHCQIWATAHIPNEPHKELASQRAYRDDTGGCLLCSYLKLELTGKERVVLENDEFVAVVPFWAIWPFELLVTSREHHADLSEMAGSERAALADIMHRISIRYDNLFRTAFPYSMGFHQRPSDDQHHREVHFHAHYYPPLLRSATVRKFMVGFEMLGGPQRDITPESAAEHLRRLPEIHYTRESAA